MATCEHPFGCELTVVDAGPYCRVATAADPEDWIVQFEKQPDFPALDWATRMTALYNAAPLRERTPQTPFGVAIPAVGYHP
jgi:hypothetical protein